MSVAARLKPEDFFSAADWARLSERSAWKGLLLVMHCWLVIALVMLCGAIWPLSIPVGVLLIGNRQLGLFILMHDAAHGLLHPNRKVNDLVGEWCCGAELHEYRPYHLQHHRFVQQAEDPDLVLSAPFPISPESLKRKMVRDLTGQTIFKQRVGRVIAQVRRKAPMKTRITVAKGEVGRQRTFLLMNGAGFLFFAVSGYWWLWLALWLLPMISWLPLVTRLRNIAEHALIAQDSSDPLRHARTTHANWAERILIAPYWVNFHCEHHMFTQLACWKLPEAHRILENNGVTRQMEVQPGYATMLRCAAPLATV
ncbi:MAG: fatty acid desaturase family protein [Burkholderiaceae bacterium]